MRSIGRDPIFIARGEGAHITDVDGNEYIDWMCSWGPLIAGHAHPAVFDALTTAAENGTSFGAPTELEVRLAADAEPAAAAQSSTALGTPVSFWPGVC